MKWGLFGGTFDPVHFGHLRAAQELTALIGLDQVVFIPAGEPPHKTGQVITPFEHRVQMVRLAVLNNPSFSCSDVESLRLGKSYSIETVRHYLNLNYPDLELYFITGQDAFNAVTTWRDWETLLGLCHFVVMTRPGYANDGLKEILPVELAGEYVYDSRRDAFFHPKAKGIFFRRTTFLDISASDIRASVQSGESIQYLTPDTVIQYIKNHKLYTSSDIRV